MVRARFVQTIGPQPTAFMSSQSIMRQFSYIERRGSQSAEISREKSEPDSNLKSDASVPCPEHTQSSKSIEQRATCYWLQRERMTFLRQIDIGPTSFLYSSDGDMFSVENIVRYLGKADCELANTDIYLYHDSMILVVLKYWQAGPFVQNRDYILVFILSLPCLLQLRPQRWSHQ